MMRLAEAWTPKPFGRVKPSYAASCTSFSWFAKSDADMDGRVAPAGDSCIVPSSSDIVERGAMHSQSARLQHSAAATQPGAHTHASFKFQGSARNRGRRAGRGQTPKQGRDGRVNGPLSPDPRHAVSI
jgi:hypothetical protein